MNTPVYSDKELHIIADDLINEDNAQYIFGVLAEMRRRYEKRIAELAPVPPVIDWTTPVVVHPMPRLGGEGEQL